MRKAVYSVGPKQAHAVGGDARYRVDKHGIEYVYQNGIAFHGKCRVVGKHDKFWARDGASDYNGPVLENPTWKALLGQATAQMNRTADFHHCFFEGYTVRRYEDGVAIIELFMGS